jgi:hypothetical protein
MVNSAELIGATEYLTLQARCRINRCLHNRVRPYLHHSACRKVNTPQRTMQPVFRRSYCVLCVTKVQCALTPTRYYCWKQNSTFFLSLLKHNSARDNEICLTRFPPSKHYHSVHGAAQTSQCISTVICLALRDHRGRYACVFHSVWMLSTPTVCRILHATSLLCQNLTEYKNRYLHITFLRAVSIYRYQLKHWATFSVPYFKFSSCLAYKCDTADDTVAQFEWWTHRCDMNSDENLRECKNVWTKWGRSAEDSTANSRNVVQSA